MRFVFPATLTPAAEVAAGETGFVVTFRDLPEAITQGESRQEAIAAAEDCLAEAIAGRMKRDDDIPEPSRAGGADEPASPPLLLELKAFLYLSMRAANVGKSELARRLGVDEKEARRLLDPAHASRGPLPRHKRWGLEPFFSWA